MNKLIIATLSLLCAAMIYGQTVTNQDNSTVTVTSQSVSLSQNTVVSNKLNVSRLTNNTIRLLITSVSAANLEISEDLKNWEFYTSWTNPPENSITIYDMRFPTNWTWGTNWTWINGIAINHRTAIYWRITDSGRQIIPLPEFPNTNSASAK